MAVLPDANRRVAWVRFLRENTEEISLSKPQIRAVVNAMDDWRSANAASLNNALPEPGKTDLTARQKAFLFMLVVNEAYGVL